MKKNIILMRQLCTRYGLTDGLRLFFNFYNGKVENVKLSKSNHPIFLRNKTSDVDTFFQIFLYNEYDIKFQDPKIIIDGGANVGLFALAMKYKYPNAKIICIEPDPGNFEVLQKNVSAYPDIYCENAGIWPKDTKLRVYDKYKTGNWGMVVEEDIENGTIQSICIDTIMTKYGIETIDILKLDIETSEKQLFAAGYENWLGKVKTLLVELHDWKEEGCAQSFFTAVNKTFPRYKYAMKGENTIIENLNA